MTRSEEPLLARAPLDAASDGAEEDSLLSGQRKHDPKKPRWRRVGQAGLVAWAILATLSVVILGVLYEQVSREANASQKPNLTGKRNLIFMVSDGMGPTSLSLTRSYKQIRDGLPFSSHLTIDEYTIGQSRTRSSNSLITDSAAGATAFSCGEKSYNGAISTLPDHTPCGTVMEAAKRAGYMTGLVVTTRITDATPACFAAHVNKRLEEDRIAEQLLGDYPLGKTVDLMLGAGRCRFLPNSSSSSCRQDDKDMVEYAKKQGFSYIDSRKDFDGLKLGSAVKLPLLGLFADHDIPYEIDREHENDKYPSLAEMTETALTALYEATRDSDHGFFLMVEGSRIDHAGHANDAAAQVHEVLAYDKAFQTVLEFLGDSKTQGLLVATSDHETGGLATARQLHEFVYPEYNWYPSVLGNASHSTEWIAHEYHKFLDSHQDDKSAVRQFVQEAITKRLGIEDYSDDEVDKILENPDYALWLFADVVSRRSQTGWSTHGHSAADVNIYASDAYMARSLAGNHENTEVGDFLRDYLDVDRDAITKELQEKGAAWEQREGRPWMGAAPVEGERLDGGSHLEKYHGDFKLHKRCSLCDG